MGARRQARFKLAFREVRQPHWGWSGLIATLGTGIRLYLDNLAEFIFLNLFLYPVKSAKFLLVYMTKKLNQQQRDARRIERVVEVSKLVASAAGIPAMAHSAYKYLKGDSKRDRGHFRTEPSLDHSGDKLTLAPAAIGNTITSVRSTSVVTSSGVRIRNRELINGSINGSVSYAVMGTYPLQPGMATTFPWLSVQAAQYEQYRIHSCRFIVIPVVSTNTAGDVILLADYNVTDPPPGSEIQALDHPGAVCGSAWEKQTFTCQPRDMHAIGPRKFIRTVNVAGDQKTFDCGVFYVAMNNGAATPYVKLFVEYDIEFFTPQLTPSLALAPSMTSYFNSTSTQIMTNATPTAALMTNAVGFDPLRFGYLYTGGVFIPPAGTYQVTAMILYSDTTTEVYKGTLAFYVNGFIYPSSTVYAAALSSGVSGEEGSLSLSAVIPFNGLQAFSVEVTLAGATGPLNLLGVQLIVNVA
jgi:hypothetical protein